jgi:poly-gamma-glutamate capsule biosynthesis protein CapA/YwtB (metallophosphatase superfamily)
MCPPSGKCRCTWQIPACCTSAAASGRCCFSSSHTKPHADHNCGWLAARIIVLHRAARFDFLSLANNHCLDYGAAGLLETQRVLQDAGMACAGAGLAAEAARPALVERAGLRIAFLSFSGGAASGRFHTA